MAAGARNNQGNGALATDEDCNGLLGRTESAAEYSGIAGAGADGLGRESDRSKIKTAATMQTTITTTALMYRDFMALGDRTTPDHPPESAPYPALSAISSGID